MLTQFGGVNLFSDDPEALAHFYALQLGVPILSDTSESYDGVELGFNKEEPVIWIWDKNAHGAAHNGPATFVFICDDVDLTHEELCLRGVELEPPTLAAWGGKELRLKDPEGNHILIM